MITIEFMDQNHINPKICCFNEEYDSTLFCFIKNWDTRYLNFGKGFGILISIE